MAEDYELRQSDELLKFPIEVHVKNLPPECVDSVVVSYHARSLLSKKYHFLLNKDYLLQTAAMTIEPNDDIDSFVVETLPEEGRIIPFEKFPEPVTYANGLQASYLMGKGTNISGAIYQEGRLKNLLNKDWGFLHDTDAENEVRASNDLLPLGMRTSLSLGYLVLNQQKTSEFLIQNSPRTSKETIRDFSGVNPAILFRLCGTRHRMSSVLDKHATRLQPMSSEHAEFKRGASHLLNESRLNSQFQEYLELGGVNNLSANNALETIVQNGKLDTADLDSYLRLLTGIFRVQREIYKSKVNEEGDASPLLEYIKTTGPRNVDSSAILYDFPLYQKLDLRKKINPASPGIVRRSYGSFASAMIESYVSNLHYFGHINSEDKSSKQVVNAIRNELFS